MLCFCLSRVNDTTYKTGEFQVLIEYHITIPMTCKYLKAGKDYIGLEGDNKVGVFWLTRANNTRNFYLFECGNDSTELEGDNNGDVF